MPEVEDLDVKLRHICREVDRHGTVRHYFRKGKGPRIPLDGEPGTDEFLESYKCARDGAVQPNGASGRRTPQILRNTLRWLTVEYFGSAEFRRLDPRTQRVRRQILEHCLREPIEPGSDYVFADFPLDRITTKAIKVLRDRKMDHPEAANGRVKALRQLFAFAVNEEDEKGRPLIERNPARDVTYFDSGNPDGFHAWTLAEVEKFEERHPIGTKARLAFALLLYLSQRRSDTARFGRQHLRHNPDPGEDEFERSIVFTQFKGRKKKPVTLEIPVIPQLWEIIEKSPTGDLTFIVTEFGRGFSDAGFGNKMRQWCDEAGLPHCSAHGLRKASTARLADLGCTTRQIMSITDHTTEKEVTRYTRSADQKRLARSAMRRVSQNAG